MSSLPSPLTGPVAQSIGRYLLIGSLVLLGGWMLRHFLPALCWAVVLAIATASLYDRWLARFHGTRRHLWAALTFTTMVGIVLIVPLVYGGVVAAREAISLARGKSISIASTVGAALPSSIHPTSVGSAMSALAST